MIYSFYESMHTNNFSPINFKGATININALSDIHGHIEQTDRFYQTLLRHDAFEKEEKGKANYLIVGGDWFISGNKTGYKTNPKKHLMDFQADLFNKLLAEIKNKYPSLKSIFIMGNHEMDGGVDTFKSAAKNLDAEIIGTNIDLDNSPAIYDLIREGKIANSKIDFIEDDKDPNLKHPVLNLGIAPVNMEYYQNKLNGINFIDNVKIAQKQVQKKDYKKTFDFVKKKVEDFRKEYPSGTVVLTCHTGVGFADECAKNLDIDLIFDGHEHKDEARMINSTPIIALSKDFKKTVNAKIILDDNGKKDGIILSNLHPMEEKEIKKGELSKRFEELFIKDFEKTCTIKADNIKELSTDGIRYQNNYLANFVTDAILEKIKEKDPEVDIFALNSSSIRGGFNLKGEPNVSNFEILNCLDGIKYEQSNLFKTKVTGVEIVDIILDNYLFNEKDAEKNPIIHYSGIEVDRTNILKDYYSNKSKYDMCKRIKSKDGKEIKPDKEYTIVNPEKYFIKAQSQYIRNLKNKSEEMNLNLHDLFRNYFKEHKEIKIIPDKRLY